MVARPSGDVRGLRRVHRLLHVAGLLRRELLLGAVPLAVLLAVPEQRVRPGLLGLRPAVRRVPALAGAADPDLPARLPADLLLLPQGLLPVILALAPGLCGRRAARQVHRRDPVPAARAERPPLVLVRRGPRRAGPVVRRDPGVRSGRG